MSCSFRAHVGEEPIVINLKGLGCMNGDPSKVDVLYANVYEIDGSTRYIMFFSSVVHANRPQNEMQ